MNWFQRRQLDFWMSTGIQDPLARATTITLYTDLQAMQSALALPDLDTIQIILLWIGTAWWCSAVQAFSPKPSSRI